MQHSDFDAAASRCENRRFHATLQSLHLATFKDFPPVFPALTASYTNIKDTLPAHFLLFFAGPSLALEHAAEVNRNAVPRPIIMQYE